MKSVLFSINKPHTDNIMNNIKTIELRTKPPKINGVYIGFIYETKRNGGSGKVIGEFTAYNEDTYRICMGVPKHIVIEGCILAQDILRYTNNGQKDVTAISITNLIKYNKPKELSDFIHPVALGCCNQGDCDECKFYVMGDECGIFENYCVADFDTEKNEILKRPPQSWCYVELL